MIVKITIIALLVATAHSLSTVPPTTAVSNSQLTMSAATFFDDTKAAGSCINITFDNKEVTPKYALGYWSIRGLGAPLTMMMCAAKVPFSLFLYDIIEDDKTEAGWKSDYFQAKGDYIKKYDAPLWNLPFCIDRENERVICQTNAVFASLGRACGMYGCDENTTSQCEQLLCEIYDLRDVIVKYSYGGSGEASPKDTLQSAKKHFKKLEAWLESEAKRTNSGDKRANPGDSPKSNVVHLVGGKFNAPDFHLYEMLDQFEEFAKYNELGNFLDDFGRLKAFKEGFSSLEENKFYLESWLHTELPFNNCMAQFGSLPGPEVYKYNESAPSATWRGKGVISMSPSSTN